MGADPLMPFLSAFSNGQLLSPESKTRWLVFNAQALPDLLGWRESVTCEQGFRPIFLELRRRGIDVVPLFDSAIQTDHALVIASRSRAMNENNIARAAKAVAPGGLIVVTGEKQNGMPSLRKRTNAETPVSASVSKGHGICFWFEVNATQSVYPDALAETGSLFAKGQADPGSILLAERFRGELLGEVADLGAGWGYLSQQAFEFCPDITDLHLFEADYCSLESARKLLQDIKIPIHFHWLDIATEPVASRFDAVVMNPPVHHGHAGDRRTDVELGYAFIRAAANMLKPHGTLFMVANRTLPYEAEIERHFHRQTLVAEEAGYKIIKAIR